MAQITRAQRNVEDVASGKDFPDSCESLRNYLNGCDGERDAHIAGKLDDGETSRTGSRAPEESPEE
jgi:hypothetical protein